MSASMAGNGPAQVSLQDALQNVDVLDELPLPDEQVTVLQFLYLYFDINKMVPCYMQ